jgi:AraC-like DNA-binding protein
LRQQDNLHRLFGEGWAISAPDLWSHSAFGLLSVASGSAPNLNEAFMTIIAQSDTIGKIWRHSLEQNNKNAYFYYDLDIDMQEKHWRTALEVGFIGLKSLLKMYLTRYPNELRFQFSCSSPTYASRLRDVLGAEVEFNAPRNAVEFPAAWLRLQSPLHDASTFRLAYWQLERENAALSLSGSISARVQRLLRARPNGRATLPETAAVLAMSTRTLVRKLGAENASFLELLEAEQQRRAKELLQFGDLKVADVAEQLGYRDPSSFARARRRWTKRVTESG